MDSARTCWAEGMGLDASTVEALTLISEESMRRAGDARPELPSSDVDAWPVALAESGQVDLAERVREILAGREERAAEARDYVDAFESEFGALPDLDDPTDAEHATAAQDAPGLRGVSWELWADAVRAEVARRRG